MKRGLLCNTWPPSLILKDRHPAVGKDLGFHFYWMVTKFCDFVNGMCLRMGNGISLFYEVVYDRPSLHFFGENLLLSCRLQREDDSSAVTPFD